MIRELHALARSWGLPVAGHGPSPTGPHLRVVVHRRTVTVLRVNGATTEAIAWGTHRDVTAKLLALAGRGP